MENDHQATHAMRRRKSSRHRGYAGARQMRRGILAFLMVMLPAAGWSGENKHPLSGALLQAQSFKPVTIRILPPEADALEYGDNELPHAYVSDLNGDGVPDYLIVASPVICGTGGCPYVLVDGKSNRAIGEFFGAIALIDQKINKYPVIQAISKLDIAAVTVSTYVFDGRYYRLTASSVLEERGISAWKESLAQEKKP